MVRREGRSRDRDGYERGEGLMRQTTLRIVIVSAEA